MSEFQFAIIPVVLILFAVAVILAIFFNKKNKKDSESNTVSMERDIQILHITEILHCSQKN